MTLLQYLLILNVILVELLILLLCRCPYIRGWHKVIEVGQDVIWTIASSSSLSRHEVPNPACGDDRALTPANPRAPHRPHSTRRCPPGENSRNWQTTFRPSARLPPADGTTTSGTRKTGSEISIRDTGRDIGGDNRQGEIHKTLILNIKKANIGADANCTAVSTAEARPRVPDDEPPARSP